MPIRAVSLRLHISIRMIISLLFVQYHASQKIYSTVKTVYISLTEEIIEANSLASLPGGYQKRRVFTLGIKIQRNMAHRKKVLLKLTILGDSGYVMIMRLILILK